MKDRERFCSAEQCDSGEKLLISHTEDMITAAERGRMRFSAFLSEREAGLVSRFCAYSGFSSVMLWGGYDDAQRVMAGFFPEYTEPDRQSFPLTRIFIGGRMTQGLTHRDYLGALLSLGIERSLTGDIVLSDGGAYCMMTETAGELCLTELQKIGRVGVKCRVCGDDEVIERHDSFESISATVASLRLDCITGAAARLSRERSAQLIRSGLVSVQHTPVNDISHTLSEGDVLSIRGYGRFILRKAGDRTKKDRIHVLIDRYV
ncbi:MAG: RNA-binding protein [Oscillospiraceae bacterium]|nr:RNA-binding protein [Oscillospiraceae bacterium]